jgi:hypothetical protein
MSGRMWQGPGGAAKGAWGPATGVPADGGRRIPAAGSAAAWREQQKGSVATCDTQ